MKTEAKMITAHCGFFDDVKRGYKPGLKSDTISMFIGMKKAPVIGGVISYVTIARVEIYQRKDLFTTSYEVMKMKQANPELISY